MSDHPCPKGCGANLSSIYALHLHLAQAHNSYEDGEAVEGRTMKGLDKVGRRVLKLLMERPEARNPSNWMLWTLYKQHYGTHILCYDEQHRGWMINRPNGVMKADDLKEFFSEQETCRRRREDYQKADRELYHQDPQNIPLHACILPKEKDAVLAEIKQGVMRRHYANDDSR